MKIDNGSNLGPASAAGASGAAATGASGRQDASRGVDSASPDSAELSGLAGKISQALSHDSTNRAAKVQQLSAQVSSGQYNPDSAAVSRGIVGEALTSAAAGGGS
jgi:flagellar biosynthesis anti-sigma factor FlgM